VTVSILQALAMLPSGEQGVPVPLADLGHTLRDTLKLASRGEQERNARHALRDRLFRDGGDQDMERVIDRIFVDKDVRDKRKAVIPYTKFSNSLKRIVGELSTVYAVPARRYVNGDDNQRKYDALIAALRFDEQMDVVNQLLNLHRAVLVAPRVRKNADGTREMVIDVATPATARAVCNPLDTTQVLAWLVSVDMPLVRRPDAWHANPAWVLWSDHEWLYLDEHLNPVGAPVEHGLGLNRWVPLSYSASALPGFWPGCEGEDLVAAQITIWLASILMLKETKSSTTQPVISGDTTTMARAQVADSESPIEAPEGVSISTIDLGTNPDLFITAADHALQRTGNNYGLSMALLTHEGTQSAEARELMLAPIRERRGKQRKIFRRFEARIAQVMARVAEVDAPELAFDPSGWRIDFGETQVLLSEKERLEIFHTRRGMRLTNSVEFLMSEDEDITAEQAMADIAENIQIETDITELAQKQMAMSGALGGNAARADAAMADAPHVELHGGAAAAPANDSLAGGA
jgi:hypothetical protein